MKIVALKCTVLRAWILLGFLTSGLKSVSGLRILGIAPVRIRSHFVLSENLFKGLAERGHQVDVYSYYPQDILIPNYRDFTLNGTQLDHVNNLGFERIFPFSVSSIKRLVQRWGNVVCEDLNLPIFQNLIKNPPNDPPYDVVLVELDMSNCFLAFGRAFNIPTVGIATTLLFDWLYESLGNPRDMTSEASVFLNHVDPMSFWDRFSNFVWSNAVTEIFNHHIQSQDKYVKKAFGEGYPSVKELEKDLSLVLMNYHPAIGSVRTWAPAVVPVGGLHIKEKGDPLPKELLDWLAGCTHGFVFMSFGSMSRIETFPKHFLDALYASIKNLQPVCFLLKIVKPEELPPELPKNARTQTWLSQVEVMKHKNIKAFVTHGGLFGTLESIYFEVPMVGIPLMWDQHFNVGTFAHQKIALSLDLRDFSEETFTLALKDILKNPIYRKTLSKVSKKFKDNLANPMDTAVFWIEYVVRNGKHALRLPIVDLPWWKKTHLDIYGVIFMMILISFFVTTKILGFVSCFFRFRKPRDMKKIN